MNGEMDIFDTITYLIFFFRMRKNSSSLGGEKKVGLGGKLHPPHFLSFFFSPKANNKKSHFCCLFFIPVSILLFIFLILTKYSINSNFLWMGQSKGGCSDLNQYNFLSNYPHKWRRPSKFMLALKLKLRVIQIVEGWKQCYLVWEAKELGSS